MSVSDKVDSAKSAAVNAKNSAQSKLAATVGDPIKPAPTGADLYARFAFAGAHFSLFCVVNSDFDYIVLNRCRMLCRCVLPRICTDKRLADVWNSVTHGALTPVDVVCTLPSCLAVFKLRLYPSI